MLHVIVFTKYPEAGYAKTRLIPAVGAERAAEISRRLTERCMDTVRTFCSSHNARMSVFYAVQDKPDGVDTGRKILDARRELVKWLGCRENEEFVLQSDGDLGERLAESFRRSFRGAVGGKFLGVIVVGTDIPDISEATFQAAVAALRDSDTVIGPAADGGFYLLGMRSFHPEIFHHVRWSTEFTLVDTARNIKSIGLSMSTLQTLRDIDLPEDLSYFEESCR